MLDLLKPMENGRYLNLDGSDMYAVAPENKLQAAFQKAVGFIWRPEFIAPLAATAGIATIFGGFTTVDMIKAATLSMLLLTCSDLVIKGSTIINGNKTICIDKQASKSVTKSNEKKLAGTLAKAFGAFTAIGVGAALFDFAMGTNNTMEFFKQSQPVNDKLTKLALTTVPLLNAYRFANIVREKWNIIDDPPKQEKREVRGLAPEMS